MPTSRQPHDPFTDAPLRPTTSNATSLAANPSVRAQASQQSLRSNASAASTRSREQRPLFAPSLSRRPTGRATPRIEDEVLVDTDSDIDAASQRRRQVKGGRHGSPESKHGRLKGKHNDEPDFVNRQPDGSYLLGVMGSCDSTAIPQVTVPKTTEEQEQAGECRFQHLYRMFLC